MRRKLVVTAIAGLIALPAAVSAEGICAPSDPAGYYACASVNLQWEAGAIHLSVRNLDTWDATLSSVTHGYKLWGIGVTGNPSLDTYLTGYLGTSFGGGTVKVGDTPDWAFTKKVQGFDVEAGAGVNGQKGAIMGCKQAGSPNNFFDTCADGSWVRFSFGTDDLTKEQFELMSFTYALRGGTGEMSYRCQGSTCVPFEQVPEPATGLLLLSGLLGVGAVVRRRRRTAGDEV